MKNKNTSIDPLFLMTEHKKNLIENSRFIEFLEKDSLKYNCKNCGNVLVFNQFQNKKDTSLFLKSLRHANFCKHKFCSMCQWRKSLKYFGENYSRIDQLNNELRENGKKLAIVMINLTVPNCEISKLKETVKNMNEAFNRFVKYKEVKKAFHLGFIKAIELFGDHTREGEAHPHIHALFLTTESYFKSKNYLSQKRVGELWTRANQSTRDLIVYVTRLKQNAKTFKEMFCNEIEIDLKEKDTVIISGLLEVLKYIAKPEVVENLSDTDLKELLKQAKGLREYSIGGLISSYDPIDQYIDEDIWSFIGKSFYNFNYLSLNYDENSKEEKERITKQRRRLYFKSEELKRGEHRCFWSYYKNGSSLQFKEDFKAIKSEIRSILYGNIYNLLECKEYALLLAKYKYQNDYLYGEVEKYYDEMIRRNKKLTY